MHDALSVVNNVRAIPVRPVQADQKVGSLVLDVPVAEKRNDGLGGALGLVEWDLGEEMVDNVVIDDFVEEVAADEAQAAVDGADGAIGEVPALVGVVDDVGVGMVEVGNGDWGQLVISSLIVLFEL